MLFVDILLLLFGLNIILALLTGYIARSNGRSFWGWLLLGLLLPFVSLFIVMLVATIIQLREGRTWQSPDGPPETPNQ